MFQLYHHKYENKMKNLIVLVLITLCISAHAQNKNIRQDSTKKSGFEINYDNFQQMVKSREFRFSETKFNADSGIWRIGGWKSITVSECNCESEYVSYNVKVNEYDVIHESYGGFSWIPKVSVLSIPIKFRPAIKYTSKGSQEEIERPQEGGIDIKNVNVGLNFFNKRIDRYFSYGTSTSHKISGGILFGLTGIGLTKDNVNIDPNNDFKDVTQLFVSTGLNLSYSYNTINFSIIPIAWDFGLSEPGRSYVYHKKIWFGFGIGIGLSRLGMPYGLN